ncbi:hypothetical protein MSG28_001811 [Choristoneura fumiferana]|uniref:Uncharacterized protein n=1 Tax=Choristoneura fumiferana TaxID=7141 RepID=A0ACC0KW83_CHOFU|nr:hypothetical protein MSG28_001811 [Choristoneura fumiferana]
MNLSFAGCGFLGIYHVGVAVCFKKYAPQLLLGKISGASFGALSACCLLCDVPIGEITSDVLRVVGEARAGSLGPFSPSFNIQNVLLEGMDKYLPHDVHKIVSGKLHISLTRVYDGKNVIVSEFPTRQDLMQALLASCFVPVFSGMLPPRFHGIRYMDGGFSDNLPILNENTVTVSPFCGESDICPRDLSSQLFHVNVANTSIELSKQNITRLGRILFPPKPEVLSNMCKQGFDDALRFLHRNNMISCTRCLAVQSTFQLQEVLSDTVYDYDLDCEECKTHRQHALVDDLPDTVMTIFQNAIDSANHGIVNWVMRQRAVRYLTILALPYRVPIDIMYATLTNGIITCMNGRKLVHENLDLVNASQRALLNVTKALMNQTFVACTPKMSRSLWKISLNMLQQLHGFVYSAHDRSKAVAQIYYKLTMDAKKEIAEEYQKDRRRASAMRVSYGDALADDTFEHILNVTSSNDALLAYYYLDSDNKMKMTEIYDVTDADTEAVQSPTERDVNKQLEFDNDWSSGMIADIDELVTDELDGLDEDELGDRNLFSDPESEWRRDSLTNSESDGEQPESDQRMPNPMVGKGDIKGSRIFHQCYVKCCKLQNLTPLGSVIPSGNGKVLDFCVDRIKYSEWPPILNAMSFLEHIDCERLAKTVNKRAVILTNFMLTNLLEAALLANNSLRHVFLPRCLVGDAGCLAICKAVRCMPNILTLDLSGCELTPLGASYIADLLKYQKIHRYSENWVHTLRYRLPDLDQMAGLRRVSVCGNPLGDAGAAALLTVLADDLWIKAMDLQNCELTESTAQTVLQMMESNTTLVVLDLRHNPAIASESLGKVRGALRRNETGGVGGQYSWLSSVSVGSGDGRSVKPIASKNGITKDRVVLAARNSPTKYASNKTTQLEELNLQLVDQMKQLKQQQIRLWANNATSSGSEQSFQESSGSFARSSSSGSSCSVPIDQNTLSYIQQAFRDIYSFIKNNQCTGQCQHEIVQKKEVDPIAEELSDVTEKDELEANELHVNIMPKKAQSTHMKLTDNGKMNKMTKSAHLLGQIQHIRESMQMKPEMFEKQIGDVKSIHTDEQSLDEVVGNQVKSKKNSTRSRSSSSVSDSSDTLVSPCARGPPAVNPRDVLCSSSDDDSS